MIYLYLIPQLKFSRLPTQFFIFFPFSRGLPVLEMNVITMAKDTLICEISFSNFERIPT